MIYQQIGGLAGIALFLNGLWQFAPLEQALLTGAFVGLAVYVLFVLGELTIRRILAFTPQFAEGRLGTGQPSQAAGRPATEPKEKTPETAA